MQPTTDKQVILDASKAAFGTEIDGMAIIADHGGYALSGDGGFMLFVLSAPDTYKITLGFREDSRGQNAIDAINAGYRWLFENTSAQSVIGSWPADGLATTIAPLIIGGEWERQGDIVVGSVTRSRWQAVTNGQ